jgi:hypothetical protein
MGLPDRVKNAPNLPSSDGKNCAQFTISGAFLSAMFVSKLFILGYYYWQYTKLHTMYIEKTI